jgi:septum formation protein
MERYLETKDSLDKAGAYGIQGPSLTFISKVDGDYANVVGFPLSRFVLECETLFQPYTSGKSWFDLF